MSDISQYPQNEDAPEEVLQVEGSAQELDAGLPDKADEVREFQLEMIDAARASAERAFDFARQLASAKTPSELMVLCMAQAQKQLAGTAEQNPDMTEQGPEKDMPNAYILARPKGHEENDAMGMVVEDDAGQILGTFDMQMEAIIWAKESGYFAQVARGGDGMDKTNPDHWRSF